MGCFSQGAEQGQLIAPQAVSTPLPNTHWCSHGWNSIISKLPSSPQQAGAQGQEAGAHESRFNIQGEHKPHTS